MSKESVLKGISEGCEGAFKTVIIIFFIVGIIVNTFLGLIIIAKLYGAEIALKLTSVIQTIFNAHFIIAVIIFLIAIFAEIILCLIKKDKKFREKRREEFGEFIKGVIDKSRRKK